MERDGDEEIERHFALVVGDEATAGAVDLAGVELGDEVDVLLREQPAERLRRDRLRERGIERRHVGDVDVVTDAALLEVPVGEERELQRRHRALDRHVDDVHDQPAAGNALERGVQRRRHLRASRR